MYRQDRNFLILCGTICLVIAIAIFLLYLEDRKVDEMIDTSGIEQEIEQSKQLAIEVIRKYEGLRLEPYDDGGVLTIGYGHRGASPDDKWTIAQAEIALIQDLDKTSGAVIRLVEVPLTIGQRAALISFTLNLGEFALKDSTLLAKLNNGDYGAVPDELQRWIYGTKDGKKVILPGLVTRREAEIDLWNQ